MTTKLSTAARLVHGMLRVTGLKHMFMDDARLDDQIDTAHQRQMHPYVMTKMRWRCAVHEERIAGVQVMMLTPFHQPATQTLVYLHGGAYLFEPSRGHWQVLDEVVSQSGARVVVPIYPRLPQYTVADAMPAMIEIVQHVTREYGTFMLAGDSAGGGLAVSLAVEMRERDMSLAQALILMSPWLDVTMEHPDIPDYEAGDLVISAPGLRRLGQMWAGRRDPHDAWVSPLYADLAGLPPVTMIVGGVELFVPDCRLFREKALAAGILAEYREFAGCMHAFMLLPTPEGRAALQIMINRLKSTKEE
jgi:acetyl esterase/lipase